MQEESKSWQRFEGKIRNLKQYLQLMDLSLSHANQHCKVRKDTHKTINLALGASKNSHQQLNIPNQEKDISRTFISARKQLNEQAFVELHCLFSDYIAHIISEIAHAEPTRLLGILGKETERFISFADIVSLGDYDSIINEMAKKVFRILENLKSTTEMMDKLCKVTKITIDNDLKTKALIYIEVRHLIIHGDSKADNKFKKRDNNELIPLSRNKLALNYSITNKAINTIYELCRTIDNALIKKKLIPARTDR